MEDRSHGQPKEKVRIVATITTIPSGIPGLKEVLYCLLNQKDRRPDKIYINLPYVFKKKTEKYPETGTNGVRGIERLINDKNKGNPYSVEVEIIRCEDRGPITKIYPVLALEKDPETLLFICDDDYLLATDTIAKMEMYALKYPETCFTTGGWVRGGKFPLFQSMFYAKTSIRKVDWLEGSGLMCIPRKFFNRDHDALLNYSIVEDKSIRKLFEKHDDHWISWHLKRNGANLLSIPEKLTRGKVKSNKDYHISGAGDKNQSLVKAIIKFLCFAREVNTLSRYLHDIGVYKLKSSWVPLPIVSRIILITLIVIIIVIIVIVIIILNNKNRINPVVKIL